ncbi:hypothetical protein WN51_11168 [Melipona quadrifasciata]|uniref:Uncharacterized protein n=1 Tax=Melipona quadrifasciata TaxID=166423 RepID=A0A0N0BI29_9HYME|nr:hypothetical protein WN51_11168 [Melipona quadrifasciata]
MVLTVPYRLDGRLRRLYTRRTRLCSPTVSRKHCFITFQASKEISKFSD